MYQKPCHILVDILDLCGEGLDGLLPHPGDIFPHPLDRVDRLFAEEDGGIGIALPLKEGRVVGLDSTEEIRVACVRGDG